jgi:integrase
VFMLSYRTLAGQRRKPALGTWGELTVEQARDLAREWLTQIRRGQDPSAAKAATRKAPTVRDLAERFIEEYSKTRNKPRTVETYQGYLRLHILPALGNRKVVEVVRADVTALLHQLARRHITGNRVLACMRKMFNMAEVWGLRPDGSNPCRHIPKYPENGHTRLITDDELVTLFHYLDRAEREELEHPTIMLAVRLQFEFAARMSEIINLQWDWIDFAKRRVAWPDSKTGGMSKPMSEESHRLLKSARRFPDSPYVCPAPGDERKPLGTHPYFTGWKRILRRAGVPHVGTHGIRHRAATDIANSGVSVKVGMALTAHKTVTMFMRYVHAEDDPIRDAAALVSERRRSLVGASQPLDRQSAEPSTKVRQDRC